MSRSIVLVGLLCLCGCQQAAPSPAAGGGTTPGAAPVAGGRGTIQEITQHPWWTKRPSPAEVEHMADQITAMNAGQWLWVNQDGKTIPSDPKDHPDLARGMIQAGAWPGEGSIIIFLDGRFYDKRLTHAEAISLLKEELDRADFRR